VGHSSRDRYKLGWNGTNLSTKHTNSDNLSDFTNNKYW